MGRAVLAVLAVLWPCHTPSWQNAGLHFSRHCWQSLRR